MDPDTIFISHATPEDNDFVRWLGARLTGHGYKVWADLLDLKGGSPFWSTIEDALRHSACKVIFVVSHNSVDPNRTNIRNELSVADSVKKRLRDPGFIIPVKIDETLFADFPIQIHQLNAIDFSKGWGSKLSELLDTLEKAGVQKFVGDQVAEFDKWQSAMVRTSTIVENLPEPVLTNLLPIVGLPESIIFFEHQEDSAKASSALKGTGVPNVSFYRLVLAFVEHEEIQAELPQSFDLRVRARVPFIEFLEGAVSEVTTPKKNEARKIATSLIRQHIERYLEKRGLKRYEGTSDPSFYFPSGLIPNDKVPYLAASGRKTNKNIVGRSERNKVNWHLAMKVNVALGPPALVRFKPYVVFSEDGQNAIGDVKKTSAIRRRFCKNWWNQHWRQLQEAFCVFLSEGRDVAEIKLGGDNKLVLSGKLLELVAARKMSDDLNVAEEPDDPIEPDDDDPDGYDDLEITEAEVTE
jgi:hypothetical protein